MPHQLAVFMVSSPPMIKGSFSAGEADVVKKGNACTKCAARALALCGAMPDDALDRFAKISSRRSLAGNEILFEEGQSAEAVYTVVSGTLRIYKLLPDGRRQITGFLATGDSLGLAVRGSYAFSAEAIQPAILCRYSRQGLDDLLGEYPELRRRLFDIATNELVAAQDQILLLGRKTAKEKICSFLLLLAAQAVKRGGSGNPITLPMSRNDIADYLGLTTETVSRTFTDLKTKGVISLLEGNRVRLGNVAEISGLADGHGSSAVGTREH